MNNALEARRLLRAHRYGALGTLSQKFPGYPFGSITPYLVDHDGTLLILISELAEHTRNIQRDPHVSLITHDQRDPDVQTQGRVTVLGNAAVVAAQEPAAELYLRHFPEAHTYLELPGFSCYRIQPVAIRFIGGFGRIHWVNMANYAIAHNAAFARAENALLTGLNTQKLDDLRQVVQQQHGIAAIELQAIGLDCDGVAVRCDGLVLRLNFAEALTEPPHLDQALPLLRHAPE